MVTLIGFLIGLAVGTTGVGGGVFTAPALVLYLGIPPAEAVGTALLFSTAIKSGAVLLFFRRRQIDWRVLGWMLLGGAPGALAGSVGMKWLQAAVGRGPMSLAVGAIVAVSAGFSLLRWKSAKSGRDHHRLLPFFSLPIGFEVGFSSAGAGVLGTLVLFSCTTLTPATVVGTDLVFGLLISALGGGSHLAVGSWNQGILLRLTAGGLPGVVLGAIQTGRLPARTLRNIILAWAVLLGLLLIYRSL